MGSSASDESSTVTGHPGRSGGTPIRYAEEVRFQKPIAPTFGYPGSALSILSLLVLAAVATILWGQLKNPGAVTAGGFLPSFLAPLSATSGLAAWTWIPFLFTMFGAGIGFVFELGLMLAGIPFQQARNGFTIFVRSVRLLDPSTDHRGLPGRAAPRLPDRIRDRVNTCATRRRSRGDIGPRLHAFRELRDQARLTKATEDAPIFGSTPKKSGSSSFRSWHRIRP